MVMSDILEEILLRLAVKDLLRSKSVCKSWYSLISSPYFIKIHAKTCNKEDGRKVAMITSYQDWYESHSGELDYTVPREWKYYDQWTIEGSSNGLVLYSGNQTRVCVTNPLTREFRELQLPQEVYPGKRCFGFGYDSSIDDYKVVLIIRKQALVHILSLKSNVWKFFGQITYKLDDETGILFNGALHWLSFDANHEDKALIVSFNLAKEEFTEILQPDDPRFFWNFGCALGIMDGRLCIYPYFGDDYEHIPSCGTWVIKNYNVKPSWELLPKDCEMYDHAIHYILNNDTSGSSKITQAYSCDENIQLSRSREYIPSPIFVQTLVSPYVNNYARPVTQ